MDRGQTAFDFAVGMGVFLLAVAFVLTFIPSIFSPFGVGAGSGEIVGDRIASTLAEDALVEDPDRPSVLNRTCTEKFFKDTNIQGYGCEFGNNDNLDELFDSTGTNVNVTIRNDTSIAKIDGTKLATGDDLRPDADVSLSRRVVDIDGEVYELWVRVW